MLVDLLVSVAVYACNNVFNHVQGACRELALVDVTEEKLKGEMMDLQHGQQFVKNITVKASSGWQTAYVLHPPIGPSVQTSKQSGKQASISL